MRLLHYKNADHPQQESDNTTGIHFNTNGWKHITLCTRRIQCYKIREGTYKRSHKVKFMSNGLQQIGSYHVHYKSHETYARFMLRLVLFTLYIRIWLTLLQHATRYYKLILTTNKCTLTVVIISIIRYRDIDRGFVERTISCRNARLARALLTYCSGGVCV